MSAPATSVRRLPGAPIWLQIIALVVGALVAAQLVTLVLTLLLPPAPPQQHSLAEIAQALRGQPTRAAGERPLIRTVEAAPPSLDSPGWVVSSSTTSELADLLDAPAEDVRILFYAPPPLAGTAPPPPRGLQLGARAEGPLRLAGFLPPFPGRGEAGAIRLAQAGPPPHRGFGGPPPGGGPMGPGMGPPAGDWRPPAGRMTPGGEWPEPHRRSWPSREPGDGMADGAPPSAHEGPAPSRAPWPARVSGERAEAPPPAGAAGPPPRPGQAQAGPRPGVHIVPRTPLEAAVFASTSAVVEAPPKPAAARLPERRESPAAPAAPPVRVRQGPALVSLPAAPAQLAALPRIPAPAPPAVAVAHAPEIRLPPPVSRSVFGFGKPSAYVEGEFVAALRTPAGWATVRPQPEGFPSSWQRRVLLWFACSLALVTPPAYLLARRLVTPLQQFADAAERLGREPTADLPPLTGPAEIGRAAGAFNLMRLRLRRYVEDRTGMISAITHDLRTPLARMRFKLERVSPPVRASLARDVDQMEAMISSVLSFMRDELSGSPRETVDLRSILECVVDEAGEAAELEPGPPAPVHVELLAIQRVFENLVDNAVKYGRRAHVRLFADGADVVVEVADEGAGLKADELEAVFKPFFRGSDARNSGAAGVGLGLAVSRSILRSHGGDITLVAPGAGLIARARLPAVAVMRAA
jgi:signal transduction histidine kinase